MSAGTPTELVRDGRREGRDPPTASPPSGPGPGPGPEPPHWIDVDHLLARLPPPSRFPVPAPAPLPRWRIVLAVALTGGSAFVTLAFVFAHPWTTPPPLPRDEVVGQVESVLGQTYIVSYTVPNDPGFSGIVSGTSPNASVGRDVVVRYDVTSPIDATVVSLTAPHHRPNGVFGWVAVSSLWAVILGSDALVLQRRWRRVQEEEQSTDYRDDGWAGSSNSA